MITKSSASSVVYKACVQWLKAKSCYNDTSYRHPWYQEYLRWWALRVLNVSCHSLVKCALSRPPTVSTYSTADLRILANIRKKQRSFQSVTPNWQQQIAVNGAFPIQLPLKSLEFVSPPKGWFWGRGVGSFLLTYYRSQHATSPL